MTRGTFPILFITATRIGDAVLSSGLIKRLADEIPNARFTIVAGPAAAPLFLDVPALDEIIVFEKSKDGGHWFRLWRQVRRTSWGLVVDLRGSAITQFLKKKRRAVYRRQPGEIPRSRWLPPPPRRRWWRMTRSTIRSPSEPAAPSAIPPQKSDSYRSNSHRRLPW